jgi:hypothetical protein
MFAKLSYLVCKHQNCLHGETSGAKVEEIFEGRAKKIHDQDVVISLRAIPTKKKEIKIISYFRSCFF